MEAGRPVGERVAATRITDPEEVADMLRQTATSSCPTLVIRTLPPSNPAVDGAELARRVAMLELVLGC